VLSSYAKSDDVFALDASGDHVQLAGNVDFGQQLLRLPVVAAKPETHKSHLNKQFILLILLCFKRKLVNFSDEAYFKNK